MNKIRKILTLGLAFGVFAGGVTAITNSKNGMKVAKADPETEITMNASFFTDWTDDAGTFRGTDATCWNGRPLNALGSVFDGCLDHEGWMGTLHSRKWNQTTQWIYFQYGCARDDHRDEASDVRLEFKLWATENAETPAHVYKFWNDTFAETTLVLRNFHISDEDFAELGGNFYMSVDLIDGRTEGYGANEFGYLHVNQTHQQVSDAQWYYYTHCVEGEAASVLVLRNHYRANSSLRDGFVYSNGFAESFDTQESFNNNWVKDIYGNDTGERHQDKAISASTYRNGDGSNMPFNNENSFFKGWYGGANNDYTDHEFGYVASDDSVYRFISKPFRLPENGIVSIKMAGNSASLHLIDFESTNDLAWVDCKTFVSGGDENPIANTNKNVCTMVRHIVNFSKYGNRLVQIGIADVDNKAGGWNAVYFDELKANYASLPSFKIDVVSQNAFDILSYAVYPDVYVNAVEGQGGVDYAFNDGPVEDTCALNSAYTAWKSYYDNVRGGKNGNNYCGSLTSDEVKAAVSAYNGLTEAAKRVFCDSEDFERTGEGDQWYKKSVTIYQDGDTYNIARSIQYLAQVNGQSVTIYSNGIAISSFGFQMDSTAMIIVAISTVIALIAFGLAFLNKKKKANR